MRAGAAHLARHSRFLGVSRRRMPGEVAGEDACSHIGDRAARVPSSASTFRPTHFSITWSATSSARWSTWVRAGSLPAGSRTAGRARSHAGGADVRRRRPLSSPAPTTMRASAAADGACRPAAAVRRDGRAHAHQDLRHHARRRRAGRGATPAPTRSDSCSGAARRASWMSAVRAQSPTRCRRSSPGSALFVDPQAADVRAILDAVPLDVLQFHGDGNAGAVRRVRPAVSQGRPREGRGRFARIRGALRRCVGLPVRHVPRRAICPAARGTRSTGRGLSADRAANCPRR